MRVALGIEYDGSAFNGWQVQKHTERTVQAAVEQAVAQVARAPGTDPDHEGEEGQGEVPGGEEDELHGQGIAPRR